MSVSLPARRNRRVWVKICGKAHGFSFLCKLLPNRWMKAFFHINNRDHDIHTERAAEMVFQKTMIILHDIFYIIHPISMF